MPRLGAGAKPLLVPTPYRFSVEAYLNDTMYAPLLFDGGYESGTATGLAEEVRDADRFVDCGANYGFFTLLARALGPPSLEVHAVEPQPEVFDRLRRNVEREGFSVSVHQAALGDREGHAQLLRPAHRASGNAHLTQAGADGDAGMTVPLRTLDSMLAPAGGKLVLKIDVEGYEWQVLRGARRLIQGADTAAVIVELYEPNTRRFGYLPAEMLAWAEQTLGLTLETDLGDTNFLLRKR